MFEINFIKDIVILPETKKKVALSFRLGAIAGGLLLISLIIKLISVSLKNSEYSKEKLLMIAQSEDMVRKYKIKEWGRKWAESYAHIKSINDIYNDRVYWSARLRELAKLIPGGMCIERITTLKDKQSVEMRIVALSSEDENLDQINMFVDALGKSRFFSGTAKMDSHTTTKLEGKDVDLFLVSVSEQ